MAALPAAVSEDDEPAVLIAHSAGCIVTVAWAANHAGPVRAALLATPPAIESAEPDDPWRVPRTRLRFPAVVVASRTDPYSSFAQFEQYADDWGAELFDAGDVGHLDTASGFGPWPVGERLVSDLSGMPRSAGAGPERDGAASGAGDGRGLPYPVADPEGVAVQLLADLPYLVPEIGKLRWREWGRAPEPEDLSFWVAVTGREAGRQGLPVTFVAIDAAGNALGAVGLAEFDLPERRDRSPWVVGTIVRPDLRGRGIGQRLMAYLERFAADRGYPRVWVATGGSAVRFYERCGWQVTERVAQATGEVATVLSTTVLSSAGGPGQARR